ncbi:MULTISPECIES: L,D-transpeptidase family protein [unclassified Streptomyces]|uniref:L,D-transpeptidase family protein n=1 Tax=unclassified Streptomyces TaxID=2593676 RepID=UPI00343B5802
MPLRTRTLPAAALLCAGALLTGCGAGTDAQAPPAVTDAKPGDAPGRPAAQTVPVADISGLGPRTMAEIPADSRQVLVVTGEGRDSSASAVALHVRDPEKGWQRTAGPWTAHNALRGWTEEHREGDLRSPIGVFGLTGAGGLLPDPGTALPYDQGPEFTISGRGFEGEPLDGSFDYVVAIDYNREPGTSPLDRARPMGGERGGGIWIHVDHGGPTQGCVSLSLEHMRELLRALDPGLHPVVVMGDARTLRR